MFCLSLGLADLAMGYGDGGYYGREVQSACSVYAAGLSFISSGIFNLDADGLSSHRL